MRFPLILILAASPAFAWTPTEAELIDPALCQWQVREGTGAGVTLSVTTQVCTFSTGTWDLAWREELPGFVQTVDGQDFGVVLHLFEKPADAGPEAILPGLRAAGLMLDDDECVFEPSTADVTVPPGVELWDIMPVGNRLAAFEASPKDEVPEPPCGDYGYAPDGVTFFMTDPRAPGAILYVVAGQDEPMFSTQSFVLTPSQ